MNVLCFGSLNIDYTYKVRHFVGKGETLSADSLSVYCGGKGLNQSIALARAGAAPFHAGAIGEDGRQLLEELGQSGVQTRYVRILHHVRTGNAIIQNDSAGDNCILLYGGANRAVTRTHVDEALAHFGEGDVIFLQNEVSMLDYMIEQAHARGLYVVLTPSPMEPDILELPLQFVDAWALNAIEAGQLLGRPSFASPEELAQAMHERFPAAAVLLTAGDAGAVYCKGDELVYQPAFPVQAVDSTAAGDTFTGFFFAARFRGLPVAQALEMAARAAALSVTRSGASASIPTWEEVQAWRPDGGSHNTAR